ncbi:MAG: hypothetical protein IJI10_09605 [Eubacterium sp.]|nr:hypothetical protein [Eubacterium sp.]
MNWRNLFTAVFMSVVLVAALVPEVVLADNMEISIQAPEGQNLTPLTGVMISGVEEPVSGQPLDETAVVSDDSGFSWEIPVLWLDADFAPAEEYSDGMSPLLVFYLPDGYTVEGTVMLDAYLSGVFHAIGHVETSYDEATGFTYIFGMVNVRYTGVGYGGGTSVTGAGRNNDVVYGDPIDDPEWDPGDLGDFDDESADDAASEETTSDDRSAESGTADRQQNSSEHTGGESTPPAPEEDTSESQDEITLYEQFAEAYKDSQYQNIAWEKEAERFGGLDQIDWDQLAAVIGYDNLKTIYENRQTCHEYIRRAGGTEETFNTIVGRMEAAIRQLQPENNDPDTGSENETAAAPETVSQPAAGQRQAFANNKEVLVKTPVTAEPDKQQVEQQNERSEEMEQTAQNETPAEEAAEGVKQEVLPAEADTSVKQEVLPAEADTSAKQETAAEKPAATVKQETPAEKPAATVKQETPTEKPAASVKQEVPPKEADPSAEKGNAAVKEESKPEKKENAVQTEQNEPLQKDDESKESEGK